MIVYPDSSIVFFSNDFIFDVVDALDEHSLVEHRSQSVVPMLDPTINPKTLDMPSDPTFQNRSKMHLN